MTIMRRVCGCVTILTLAGCKITPPADNQANAAADMVAAAPAPTPKAPPAAAPMALPPEINASLTPAPTQPGDAADSHDPGFLKRYQGSHIVSYTTRSFDQLDLPIPDLTKPGEVTTETHEDAELNMLGAC